MHSFLAPDACTRNAQLACIVRLIHTLSSPEKPLKLVLFFGLDQLPRWVQSLLRSWLEYRIFLVRIVVVTTVRFRENQPFGLLAMSTMSPI